MNEDLDYIKKFSKITIANACERAGVKKNNLWSGKTSKKNINKVRKILENDVATLYLLREVEDETNNTL